MKKKSLTEDFVFSQTKNPQKQPQTKHDHPQNTKNNPQKLNFNMRLLDFISKSLSKAFEHPQKEKNKMKPTHLLAALIITALILACFAAPAAAFSGAGSGTQSDPYIITTPAQLQEIANDLDAYYQLGNNIDLSTINSWNPIISFTGSLDGNGYKISNYNGGSFIMFQNPNGMSIKNIHFDSFTISGGHLVIIQSPFSTTNINNIIISDCSVTSGSILIFRGGWTNGTGNGKVICTNCMMYDCTAIASEATNGRLGVGQLSVGGEISNTIIYGNVQSSSISNSQTTGGIIPHFGPPQSGATPIIKVSDSVVLGNSIIRPMMSNQFSGRISGYTSNEHPTVNNCYALSSFKINGGTVSGTTSNYNGADITTTQATSQSFYENTLGWDFSNTWYWDNNAEWQDATGTTYYGLPKLQVFIKSVPPTISSISATPATGGQLTEYTLSAIATTEAEGGIASYQWSYSTDSGTTWQPISGATAATYVWTPGTSISGSVLLKCYITGADGGTVDSYEAGYTSIQITVVPPPEIDSVSASRTLQKVNTPTTLTATFGDIQTGNTYQWYYSTNGGTTWQAISGATQPTATYTPTTTGLHNIKIVVTTQYGDTTETTTSITVLPTYTPTPITNTSVDISIDSTAKYQGMQQFTLSSELKALNYYTPNLAHLAHDNALYYLDSAEREVIPVSTTTGGTISAAYVGQYTGIITDTAGNTAFYSYQTNDWQYVEQNSASIIASTSSYAATVSGGTLRIYNLNGNLVASTATTAANLAGNDATNVFVSYNDKTLTYYWVNGNSISTASQTLTHSITELHQISGTNNFIISTTANTIVVEITDAGVYSLVATSETDTPLIHTQATSINIFIGVSTPNEIFIIGADGETDGTYVTGSTLSDASIAKATGLYAIAGGADYQAYILSKSDSSVWQLQQVVNFGEAIDYSQISTTGTYAAVATGLKLYLLESKDTSSSVYYLQGVVIGSTGKPYAGKTITINGDSIRTDTKGMFLYPVQPGNLVTITAGDTTIEYTPSSAALQQIAIRIKAGLLSTDVTYSADYSTESQAIIMAYDDAAGKTTAVNWKVYETANNTLVATYTGNTASYPIEAGDVYNNYYVQLSADRGGATVTNTWSITPAGGQPIDLYGLDEDGRNIIFGFLLLLLAGLFGVMHSRSGAIIVALGACVMRYLELITIPWILITIAAVLAIVAAIAHGGQNR